MFNQNADRFSWVVPAVAVLVICIGAYLLLLSFAPMLPNTPLLGVTTIDVSQSLAERPGARGDRLYIPKINVDLPIGDDQAALEKGAWHRMSENGNPERGGNFVLSAHRFVMGWTPQTTRNNSPFYHLDRLQPGDEIFVDYNAKRTRYKVDRLYPVPKNAVEIEGPSKTAKLTLYSCDLRGESAGRLVVEALPAR
jgi:LPXTG-site transpeptidase (sortase) family protein